VKRETSPQSGSWRGEAGSFGRFLVRMLNQWRSGIADVRYNLKSALDRVSGFVGKFPKFVFNVLERGVVDTAFIMTSVATSLWDSIFTPGPTPILVRAMNISFFALFALLAPLIYVTKNIHVVFLTILAVGLWIAMQW
jgi:hypothetical protein